MIATKLSQLPYLPMNLVEEKKKFFNSDTYNPTFVYDKPHGDLNPIKQRLLSIDIDSTSFGIVFKKKQEELQK